MLKLIRGLSNIPNDFGGCVATIGNFDGIHLGHQALISTLMQKSHELRLPAVLITFEPQPPEFFATANAPARLMRLRDKWLALQPYAVDYLLCLRFNQQLAGLSAEAFVQTVLVEKLKVRYLLVGDDFGFGKHRAGNIALLQQQGLRWHFSAQNLATYTVAGTRVSSSQVRLALQAGDMAAAKTLLGRNYSISGRVSSGQKRGRSIGFPTANIFLHRKTVPINGVYAVKISGLAATALYGVANVGTRPTVDGTHHLLEVHIFNFDADIYGRCINVEFIKKLRDEQRFSSFELLHQQILKDAAQAKAYLKQT